MASKRKSVPNNRRTVGSSRSEIVDTARNVLISGDSCIYYFQNYHNSLRCRKKAPDAGSEFVKIHVIEKEEKIRLFVIYDISGWRYSHLFENEYPLGGKFHFQFVSRYDFFFAYEDGEGMLSKWKLARMSDNRYVHSDRMILRESGIKKISDVVYHQRLGFVLLRGEGKEAILRRRKHGSLELCKDNVIRKFENITPTHEVAGISRFPELYEACQWKKIGSIFKEWQKRLPEYANQD